MSFIVINVTNQFDGANNLRFNTEKEAEEQAVAILESFPKSVVYTAQLLKSFTASVAVTNSSPPEPTQAAPEPDTTAPA